MFLAPRWAFAAQAIDATGDPRLAKGVHVRALLSMELGLPAAPLVVYRLSGESALRSQRSDIRWVDSRGAVLSYPFNVTPDNPVTGWLPAGSHCCWFSMQGKAAEVIVPVPHVGVPHTVASMAVAKPEVAPISTGVVGKPAIHAVNPLFPIAIPPSFFTRRSAFQLDAVVSTDRGPGVIATRTGQPYEVAASHIEYVVVHGKGTVADASWIDASNLDLRDRLRVWRQWSLPVNSGPRYLAGPTAVNDAKQRVLAGAPTRHALYEDPSAASVASASPASAAEELARVTDLASSFKPWVQRLVSDTTADPWSLQQDFTVQAGQDPANPDTQGKAQMPLMGMVLHSMMDPGLARWSGVYDVDTAPPGGQGNTAFYLISGIWHLDRERFPKSLVKLLPKGSIFNSAEEPVNKRMPLQVDGKLPDGDYVELWAVAAAVVGAPGDPPSPPGVVPQASTWMPSPPTAPTRQIPIDVSDLVPAAALAFARGTSPNIVPLNPRDKNNKLLPIMFSPAQTALATGSMRLADRKAPPGVVPYRLAQSDWFGRFSPWTMVNAPDLSRTAPPKPSLEVFYTPPAASDTGPLAGTLTVRASIPSDTSLPPGCEPLTGLILSASASGVSYVVNATYPATGGSGATLIPPVLSAVGGPPPKPALLSISLAGPSLQVAASTYVTLNAQWQTATAISTLSDPVKRFIGDPRPVPPPPIPSDLRYAAKPDAMNRARFEITLPAITGAKYRVYFADENQLIKGLQNLASSTDGQFTPAMKAQAGAAATALTGALVLNHTDRAAAFMGYAALYTWDMFQNLTVSAMDPGTFAHTLPGDLKTLSFYRVITWNAANVASDFATSPLVPVAVPNDPPPARPAISVQPVQSSGAVTGVAVTVRVPKSLVDPVQYRVRRSFAGATPDPRRMLVVHEGSLIPGKDPSISDFSSGRSGTYFIYTDSAGIKPWHHYAWAVEVRGGAPIGSPAGTTIHGDYGPPSKPASTMIVPPSPPDPVASFNGSRDSSGKAALTWTVTGNPVEMMSTDLGPHRFELYRIPAGARPAVVPMTSVPQPDDYAVFRFTDPDTPTGPVSYRIVVIDPLGRVSRPSAHVDM